MVASEPCCNGLTGRVARRLGVAIAVLAGAVCDIAQAAAPRPVLQLSTAGTLEAAVALRDGSVVAAIDRFEVVLRDADKWFVIDRVDLPPPDRLYMADAVVPVRRPDQTHLVLWQQQVRQPGTGPGDPVCRLLELDAAARRWARPRTLPDCKTPASLPQSGQTADWNWALDGGGISFEGRHARTTIHPDGSVSGVGGGVAFEAERERLPVIGAFVSADGTLVASLVPEAAAGEPLSYSDLPTDPDPQQEADAGDACVTATAVKLWNAATGDLLPDAVLPGRFDQLRWIRGDRLLALPTSGTSRCPQASAEALLIDAASATVTMRIPAQAQMTVLGADELVALATDAAGNATGVMQRRFGGHWAPLTLDGAAARQPVALGAAFGGRAVAVAGRDGDRWVFDLHRRRGDGGFAPAVQLWRSEPGETVTAAAVHFSRDDARVMLSTEGSAGHRLRAWQTADGMAGADVTLPLPRSRFVTGDALTIIAGDAGGVTNVLSATSGKIVARLPYPGIIAATMLPEIGLLWTIDTNDVIRLFDRQGFALRLTVYRLPGYSDSERPTMLMVAPDGRYDSTENIDTTPFRWAVADMPWSTLPASTFMRDYFTPGLYDKVVRCTAARTCDRVLPAVADVSTLNRILPDLRIDMVQHGQTALVTVTDISPPGAGVHDIRVLREGQLVKRIPGGDAPTDLAGWRSRTDARAGGQRQWAVQVSLPSGTSTVNLGAYAFNSDRVKGETSFGTFQITPVPQRKPRAYVIAAGADDYPLLPGRNLNFAAADAEATARMLRSIIGFEVVPIVLVSRQGRDQARADVLAAVLRRLSGRRQGGDDQRLAAAGIDAARLAKATPDDALIFSFAGHGWADAEGHFHFLGSDASAAADGTPDPATMLGADALAGLLQNIDAGTMAMVIDACHSAASVPAGFKPGPLGETGLAQLAYDKRVRILAATQADDVAIEDVEDGHGLLTSVLLETRQMPTGTAPGLALEALFKGAVRNLPAVARRRAAERAARASAFEAAHPPLLTVNAPPPPPPRIQQPAMFDFDTRPGVVVLPPAGG